MFDRLGELLKDLFVGIYFALLGGRDHSLKAHFEPVSKILSRSKEHTGFALGNKQMTAELSSRNLAVISPTGGGKTTCHLYNSILTQTHSMLINDPSGELAKTKPYLLSQEFVVKTLFLGKQDESVYYNPLSRIEKKSDIFKVASLLVRSRSSKDADSFWNLKAIELIGMLISFVLESTEKTHHHLGQVFRLVEELQADPETIERLFSAKASEDVWRKFKSLQGANENTRASIIATGQSCLSFLDDPILANQLSTDTIDFNQFRTQKTALFITTSPTEIEYYKPIFSLFFEQFFNHIFKALPKEEDLSIYLLLDELATSLYLPNLGRTIAFSRKYRIPIAYCIQSESQLLECFGKSAHSILSNAVTKVYFGGLEVSEESGRLEKTLGRYNYTDDKDVLRERALITADDIRCLGQNEVIVTSRGIRGIKTWLTPFYQQSDMIKKMETNLPDNYDPSEPHYTARYLHLEPYRNKNQDHESEV